VKLDGSIDLATGAHVNGLADVTGAHADPNWSLPTVHGYAANANGLQTCTPCHVGFGSAGGSTGSACNVCHGGMSWQTNCVFCHGAPGRVGHLAGTDPLLAAAPPVGTAGESASSQPAVGAHQAHVDPPASGALSRPVSCLTCHPAPLPVDVTHVDGSPTPVVLSGLAVADGLSGASYAGGSCATTYCHGSSLGSGSVTSPGWTAGPAAAACGACHAVQPGLLTERHYTHVNDEGASCGDCHSGYSLSSVSLDLHVNGTRDVGGLGTSISAWDPLTRVCTAECHQQPRGW
jgi:predicted CxxxxCH...CXXCH cytochrome family protein